METLRPISKIYNRERLQRGINEAVIQVNYLVS